VNREKEILIEKARNRHKEISPCSRTGSWEEAFTVQGNLLLLWYNTEGNTTRILVHSLEEAS